MENLSITTIILGSAFILLMMKVGFHVGVTLANIIETQYFRWRNR